MGVRFRAQASSVDLGEDPPPSLDVLPSAEFVIQETRTSTLLVFAFGSYNFEAEILPEPTLPGHGLDNFHEIVSNTIWEGLLRSGCPLK